MRGANLFFNVMTWVFLALSVVSCFLFYSIATDSLEPAFFAPEETAILPTVASLGSPTPKPSWTPSNTPVPSRTYTPSPTPTDTPLPTVTPTSSPTITATPTITQTSPPSPTNTLVPSTNTPTKTPTPTVTPTFTFTPSPTGPSPTATQTLSPYPFKVQPQSIILRENYANAAGCNWQGIAGQVTTTDGAPVVGVQVRVTGDDVGELVTISGTNQFYGPSGWEIVLGSQPNNNRYQVALWSGDTQVSPVVEIVFPNSCQQNLTTMNFIQTRPY